MSVGWAWLVTGWASGKRGRGEQRGTTGGGCNQIDVIDTEYMYTDYGLL